jgi:hypothetical protein
MGHGKKRIDGDKFLILRARHGQAQEIRPMVPTLKSNSPFSAPRDDTARASCRNGAKSIFLSLIGFRAPDYNTLGFDVWNWGGGTLLQAKPPEPRVWHHCVYTFDGNTRRFFVDTKELSQSNTPPQEGPSSILMFGNYPKGNQYFNGKLDDIRIYNRSIDTPEIEHLFNVQR